MSPVPMTQAPSADPALASVDSLMWQQPDSALTRLIPHFDRDYSSIKRSCKKLHSAFNTQENMAVFLRNIVLSS